MVVSPLPMILPQAAQGTMVNQNRQSNGDKSFGEVLLKALDEVNRTQLKADDAAKKFLVGEIQDIHQVTIAMEEARLMMQLAVEVRSKIIEAYQEISRMQV
ncbi:MAG: flagellar hook-basal body complex protein FliE [Peptococcaceae bacterium]|nr:flagellar hook-basal body complex protein FliE [Peptococcaceae bacterium]